MIRPLTAEKNPFPPKKNAPLRAVRQQGGVGVSMAYSFILIVARCGEHCGSRCNALLLVAGATRTATFAVTLATWTATFTARTAGRTLFPAFGFFFEHTV